MKRSLVVVSPTERGRNLLREAGELAAGTGAELVLLSVTPEDEYEDRYESVAEGSDGEFRYTVPQAETSAARVAASMAAAVLDGLDVEYRVVGEVGREAKVILEVAESEDVDHIFVAGRRRSPTGKMLFGDLVQTVLLSFDGPVTCLLGDGADGRDVALN